MTENKSETIFRSFINLLNLNFGVLTIQRVKTKRYEKSKLRSCDFIININSGGVLLKCGVEIKSIGYDTYHKLKQNEKTLKNDEDNIIGTSCGFSCSPSRALTDSVTNAAPQLKNVVKDKFPSILLIYPCTYLYNVVVNDAAINEWMCHEEMSEGCLKDNPHINGICLLNVYAGKISTHFYRNPYSTIAMGWEYNILFSDVKVY